MRGPKTGFTGPWRSIGGGEWGPIIHIINRALRCPSVCLCLCVLVSKRYQIPQKVSWCQKEFQLWWHWGSSPAPSIAFLIAFCTLPVQCMNSVTKPRPFPCDWLLFTCFSPSVFVFAGDAGTPPHPLAPTIYCFWSKPSLLQIISASQLSAICYSFPS